MGRNRNPRRKYTEEYKKDAVRLMMARGSRTVGDIATELGLNESLLHKWYRRYRGEVAAGGAGVSQNDREDMERMRRRLRELEQENALLKKAAALFAKEMK